MSSTNKPLSEYDFQHVIRKAHNEDGTLGVNGFIVGQLGRKITRTLVNSTTEDYSFFDGTTLLYTIRIIYTDSSRADLASVERTV